MKFFDLETDYLSLKENWSAASPSKDPWSRKGTVKIFANEYDFKKYQANETEA